MKKIFIILALLLVIFSCSKVDAKEEDMKTIYLAGGCFWGVEEYFSQIDGIVDVISGYANSNIKNPSYQQVCSGETNASETVLIKYNDKKIALDSIINYYFNIIDPTSLNKQGNDIGTQYRTGIYYIDDLDLEIINRVIKLKEKEYNKPLVIEVLKLENFYEAEDYHQDYLKKNPFGYCHISFDSLKKDNNIVDIDKYSKPINLESILTGSEYEVTQNKATDPPFRNKYWDSKERGIYVDIVTKEPLFLSSDKFDSGCGWPSFTKPIFSEVINYKNDNSFNMVRTEVTSRIGDSHLGHVFEDGPKDKGGLRYCINSSSLEFISYEKMEERGYGKYKDLLKE